MEVWNQIRLFFDNLKVKMRHVKYLVQQTFLATAKLRPCAPRYAPARPNAPRAKKYKEKL